MTKEAKELIEFWYHKIPETGFCSTVEGWLFDSDKHLQNVKNVCINDLNNTIKALQKLNKRIGKLTPIALDIFEDEIEKYQQLLNEIQNEQ